MKGFSSGFWRSLPLSTRRELYAFWATAWFYCVINAIGLQVVGEPTDSMDIARGILQARR